jgi:hypothetical protein
VSDEVGVRVSQTWDDIFEKIKTDFGAEGLRGEVVEEGAVICVFKDECGVEGVLHVSARITEFFEFEGSSDVGMLECLQNHPLILEQLTLFAIDRRYHFDDHSLFP